MDWFEAARMGDVDTLNVYLIWGQRVNQRDADGRTALNLAAEHGHADAVHLLLARNADPNLAAPGVTRPLTAAVEHERWEMAAALVRGGADPNADGVASIVIAEPPKRKLLAIMLEHELDPHGAHPEWGPYVDFALNDPACWDMFLVAGFDLARHERETEESLLERALSHGVSRFLHLLSLGANVNLPVDRSRGRTMLMTLAGDEPGEQSHALIRLLVRRGADLDQRDGYGRTAFDYAAERDPADQRTVALLTQVRKELTRAQRREEKRAADARAREERQAADARKREAKRVARATAKARAAEVAAKTRQRNAAARQAAAAAKQAAAAARQAIAAERRAAREFERLEKAQMKLAARAAAAAESTPPSTSPAPDAALPTPAAKPKPNPAAPRQRRRPLRDFAVSERLAAKNDADGPAAKQPQHG